MLTYKRKLILNKEQEERISSWIGACRVVYNVGLEIRISAYKSSQKSVSAYDLIKQIPDIREDFEWLQDVPAESLQNTMERLDSSYKMFFRGGGFPKFATKRSYKSILFKRSISISDGKIKLPKIGYLKMVKDAPIFGTPKRAIIIKEPTGYFVCILCEGVVKDIQNQDESQVCGIDMGITNFYVDSNGNTIENPRHFKKYERKLRVENRSLARKVKGSNRWKRQAKKLGLLHYTIANVRKDFLHKESTALAKKYHSVYVEDLKINNMASNKNLSKHILDCGWGMFRTMLEYKTNVIRINPKYTSQECNECGVVDGKSRISQSKFKCTHCGHESNADHNAAKNILGKGVALNREREAVACALVLESRLGGTASNHSEIKEE